MELFLFEPQTNRYLGRLCYFKQCPAGKPDCLVPGCGEHPFLKQHPGFAFWPDGLDPSRMAILFDRSAGGIIAQATALPSIIDDAPRRIEVTVAIPENRRGELEELVRRWNRDD